MGSIARGRHVLCAQTDFALLLWAGQCEKKLLFVTAAIGTIYLVVAAAVVAAAITV